jgi:hypothetical protein
VQEKTGFVPAALNGFMSIHEMQTHLEIRVGLVDKINKEKQGGIILELPYAFNPMLWTNSMLALEEWLEPQLNSLVVMSNNNDVIFDDNMCECCAAPMFFINENEQQTLADAPTSKIAEISVNRLKINH